MQETRQLCDVEGCGTPNARTFTKFKERKSDGAGSREDWYYTFDLCVNHAGHLLDAILPDTSLDTVLEQLKTYGVHTRVE